MFMQKVFGKLFETPVDILTCMGYTIHVAGCGSVWLERLVWDQEAAGSNPVTPMVKPLKNQGFLFLCCISCCIVLKNVYWQWRSFPFPYRLKRACKLFLIHHQFAIHHAA